MQNENENRKIKEIKNIKATEELYYHCCVSSASIKPTVYFTTLIFAQKEQKQKSLQSQNTERPVVWLLLIVVDNFLSRIESYSRRTVALLCV